jgi:hypothetical protein
MAGKVSQAAGNGQLLEMDWPGNASETLAGPPEGYMVICYTPGIAAARGGHGQHGDGQHGGAV